MAKTVFNDVAFTLSDLIGDIDRGRLALPEIQRPFVWKRSEVRDLLDSMYKGFPIGYLMIWRASSEDAKFIGVDGKQETPTEFIVDGQQRLTSLYTILKGTEVLHKDHSVSRIRIAFRPRDAAFEVTDAAIEKDPEFLPDISAIWTGEDWEVITAFVDRLREAKPELLEGGGEKAAREALNRLSSLDDYPLQAVMIGPEVDEETVAEIFLRVNSGGTKLQQADFILTLLSVFREEERRRLETFSYDATVMPSGGEASPFNHLIQPAADQLLRVSILVAFHRGSLHAALSLLRGASVDGDKTLDRASRDDLLDQLSSAIDEALNLTNWHEYLKAVLAAGYRRKNEISSPNTIVLVYALYLIGLRLGVSHSDLRTPIARYFFMASLTGRYTGSFESRVTQDVQDFTQAETSSDYLDRLNRAAESSLTNDYWGITLPTQLATSSANGPALYAYAAALSLLDARVPPFVESGEDGAQKAGIKIRDLFDPMVVAKKAPVERHHLFPRAYLAKSGITSTPRVNQIANMSYVEWPENIEISDSAPSDYWPKYVDQFSLNDRFVHALPDDWHHLDYDTFLEKRRASIAAVIRKGFESIGQAPNPEELLAPEAGAATDMYLHPDTPFSNDLAIRKVIRDLRGDVFWYEQHMDRKALELLEEELTVGEVASVSLLSGPANVTSKVKKAFDRFQTEMGKRGLACEWKVIPVGAAREMHARVISDDSLTYEVPPLNSLLAGTVDSIRTSEIPMDSFRSAWESAVAEPLREFSAAD